MRIRVRLMGMPAVARSHYENSFDATINGTWHDMAISGAPIWRILASASHDEQKVMALKYQTVRRGTEDFTIYEIDATYMEGDTMHLFHIVEHEGRYSMAECLLTTDWNAIESMDADTIDGQVQCISINIMPRLELVPAVDVKAHV